MGNTLAIIGGSGFEMMPGAKVLDTYRIDTPYGSTSSPIISLQLGTSRLLLLSRHGQRHEISPHEINYRANICALKLAGATHILSISAVGSLREELKPGELVVVSDFIDQTRRRISTFLEGGVVGHVSMARPVCDILSAAVTAAAHRCAIPHHESKTYVCIEGPQFSSQAESRLFRQWGADVIGMTAMPEAKLCREAELAYALAAFVTDYDCWRESEEAVTVEQIVATLRGNTAKAHQLVTELAQQTDALEPGIARGALSGAILTNTEGEGSHPKHLGWLLQG